uniref:peptidoglycan-binding domain-containing protein n=1 Tax=Actinacidiphila soli TaxID=2487275 RepID=UPI0019D0E223
PPSRSRRRSRRRAPRRRRPVIAGAGAVLAVGVIVVIAGLLGGTEQNDRALPDDNASLPSLVLPSGGDAASASGTSASAALPGHPTASASGASRTTATATATASVTSASAAATHGGSDSAAASGTVLKPGARGAEVVELQERLAQLQLYDEPADGKYDGGVRDAVLRFQQAYNVRGDTDGVYGTNTRRALEARTAQP